MSFIVGINTEREIDCLFDENTGKATSCSAQPVHQWLGFTNPDFENAELVSFWFSPLILPTL